MSINYSVGTRAMSSAGRKFAKQAYLSYRSEHLAGERWVLFADFLGGHTDAKKMEHITREMVVCYAGQLLLRYEKGELARKTMQCYLSAVNVILRFAAPGNDRQVHFARDLKLPREPCRVLVNRGARYDRSLCASLPSRVFAMSNLQRELGLRFEESAKINAREAWWEARETGQITIREGTKGGKVRIVPIRNEALQLSVLRIASEFQGNHKSMIPEELTYKRFISRTYGAAYRHGVKFHDARHAYAQAAYSKLTGWPPPIALMLSKKEHKKFVMNKYDISNSEFVERDRQARLTIARELGHERVQISRTYLG